MSTFIAFIIRCVVGAVLSLATIAVDKDNIPPWMYVPLALLWTIFMQTIPRTESRKP